MAEILNQQALVLAETEITFGVDPVPDAATDAILAEEPDFSLDLTSIERNFARNSISPLPRAAGRKIASMTFLHEMRNNGDLTTAPRLGRLLEACGYVETQIVTNGPTNGRNDSVGDTGNTTTADFFSTADAFAHGGTNSIIQDGEYRIRITLAGASGVATARVSGGIFPDDQVSDAAQDEDRIFTETFCVELISSVGTVTGAVVVDDTGVGKPVAPEYDFTGLAGLSAGDVWRLTLAGMRFTVTASGATPTTLGADFEAAIDAHGDFGSTNAAGVLTIDTMTGAFASTALTTDTTALTLGASGHTITVGTVTAAVLNDAWSVTTKPIGWEYTPISTAIGSITIHMYLGSGTTVRHVLTASRGTFTIDGPGGDLAKFNFTFTGNYNAVTDVAVPSATFETQVPVQVELAKLHINEDVDATAPKAQATAADVPPVCDTYEDQINGSTDGLCAASFSFDQGNEIQPRECINEADSFKGVVLTSRAPTGSIDPELELVATHDFWDLMATADVLGFQVVVGQTRANVVRMESDSVQYVGLSYAERNGLRVMEADLAFSATSPLFADDEVLFAFN